MIMDVINPEALWARFYQVFFHFNIIVVKIAQIFNLRSCYNMSY